jgi:HEPN domain-containing protein
MMDNPSQIKDLSKERIEEAEILYKNGKFNGAFYLAGYSVELMLKAKICERLGIPNLFEQNEREQYVNQENSVGDVRKAIKTHNLWTLLLFCGLKEKFDKDKAKNKYLTKANSVLFDMWSETARYKPCGHYVDNDVKELIQLLSAKGGFLEWIEKQRF